MIRSYTAKRRKCCPSADGLFLGISLTFFIGCFGCRNCPANPQKRLVLPKGIEPSASPLPTAARTLRNILFLLENTAVCMGINWGRFRRIMCGEYRLYSPHLALRRWDDSNMILNWLR
jgi:hypothetical protein